MHHRVTAETFSDAYCSALTDLIAFGEDASPRGQQTRELLHFTMSFKNPRARTLNVRKYSTSYAVAECLWYLLGSNQTSWISHYAKLWDSLTKDGTATSAYGTKWLPQLPRVLKELRESMSSRRAVVNILTPNDYANELDVPCTIALQYIVRDGKLHAQTYMRSCDAIWGLPYDVFSFTVFQEILATELGLGLGNYVHTATSLHIYGRHLGRANAALEDLRPTGTRVRPPPMAPLTLPIPVTTMEREERRIRRAAAPCDSGATLIRETSWADFLRVLNARNHLSYGLAIDADRFAEEWDSIRCPGLRGSNKQ